MEASKEENTSAKPVSALGVTEFTEPMPPPLLLALIYFSFESKKQVEM